MIVETIYKKRDQELLDKYRKTLNEYDALLTSKLEEMALPDHRKKELFFNNKTRCLIVKIIVEAKSLMIPESIIVKGEIFIDN